MLYLYEKSMIAFLNGITRVEIMSFAQSGVSRFHAGICMYFEYHT